MYRKLTKFVKLPLKKKFILVETFFMLGIGRITVLLYTFPAIKQRVEYSVTSNKNADSDNPLADLEIIKWSVAVMSRYTPWKSNCFAQALAAHKMLGRRGISSTLHFGLAREDEGTMAAHAWLMYRDTIVTGERQMKRFKDIMQISCE